MEQKVTEQWSDIDKSIATLKYFSTTLSKMEQVYKIISNYTQDLYNIVTQLDTITIYRTLNLIKEQNTYSFQRICTWNTYQYRPYSQHKASVYKFKNDQVIEIILSDYSGIKLEIGNVKVSWNSPNIWKLNSVISVDQSCPTLCDPMDCHTPDFPVHHQPSELAQTQLHWVGDAIQPFNPLWSPSPPKYFMD